MKKALAGETACPMSLRKTLFWAVLLAGAFRVTGSATVRLRVAADGSADYMTVQKTIDAAPADGAVISIAPGTYREVVKIAKNNIQLRGTNGDPARLFLCSTTVPERRGDHEVCDSQRAR